MNFGILEKLSISLPFILLFLFRKSGEALFAKTYLCMLKLHILAFQKFHFLSHLGVTEQFFSILQRISLRSHESMSCLARFFCVEPIQIFLIIIS